MSEQILCCADICPSTFDAHFMLCILYLYKFSRDIHFVNATNSDFFFKDHWPDYVDRNVLTITCVQDS